MLTFLLLSAAIHAASGRPELVWKYETSGLIAYSSPAVSSDGSMVYSGSTDRYVYALFAENGTLAWKYETGASVYGSAALSPDGEWLAVCSQDSYYYYFSARNGTVKWASYIKARPAATPVFSSDGSAVYAVANLIVALSVDDGSIVWRAICNPTYWSESTPALSQDESTLCVGRADNKVSAFSTVDGALLWAFETGYRVYAEIILSPDYSLVVAGSSDSQVYALSSGE